MLRMKSTGKPLTYSTQPMQGLLSPVVGSRPGNPTMALPILGGRRGKRAEALKSRGGPKNKPLSEMQIKKIMDDHGMENEYHDNGGVTVTEYSRGTGGALKPHRKHFKDGAHLETIRKWLGY